MTAEELREEIRSYRVMCHCWDRGTRPGFRATGNPPYLLFDGTKPQEHFTGCEWVAAVNQIYELERRVG